MASLCNITGTITGGDGTPVFDAEVMATIQSTADDQSGQIAAGAGITSDEISAFTDVNGVFSLALIQGAVYELNIPSINLRKIITVPADPTIDFISLI